MSQPEFLTVVAVCKEAEELQRATENHKWESWGRVGTLTREQIKRQVEPDWAWDDYSI